MVVAPKRHPRSNEKKIQTLRKEHYGLGEHPSVIFVFQYHGSRFLTSTEKPLLIWSQGRFVIT